MERAVQAAGFDVLPSVQREDSQLRPGDQDALGATNLARNLFVYKSLSTANLWHIKGGYYLVITLPGWLPPSYKAT